MSMDADNSPKPPIYPPQNIGGSTNQQGFTDVTLQTTSTSDSLEVPSTPIDSDPMAIATMKAQEAIRLNAQNPHEQQKEIAAIRRSYIKQQYGIELP